jgi:CRISPR-associated endonuclease/helicase Cas3
MQYDDFFRTAMGGDFGPYAFQRAFATSEDLPQLVRAPTGAGKTATAVLGWWWRRKYGGALAATTPRRLVFCLPMRTLVHQTVQAVDSWKKRLAAAGLDADVDVHALLGGHVDQTWESEPDRDLVLVGTQDQLLSRALNRGYAMSRYRWSVHFAFLNNDALWVMDEVQLMGVGLSTSAQLQGFGFQTHGPRKTVWMSATLAEGKLATVDTDMSAWTTLGLETADRQHPRLSERLRATKRVQVLEGVFAKKATEYAKTLAPRVLQAHRDHGGRTLVVLNQVDRAIELTRALRKRAGDVPVYVVHSRFRPAERAVVQDVALADEHAIVVATQAIEAGVDISSRTLFTELASWSSLVQRFGRCNRGGEHEAADVYCIDVPADDKLALPYTADDLVRARELIDGLPDGDAAPDTLPAEPGPHEPTGPVLRRRDLVDLFDTTADLSGFDIDVSRYIRDTGAPEVQVAWRSWEGQAKGKPPTGEATRAMKPDELCRVPLHTFDKLFGSKKLGFVWDPLERTRGRRGAWVVAQRVKPGDIVLLPTSAGGYHVDVDTPAQSLGFTADKKHRPQEVSTDTDMGEPESDGGEPDSMDIRAWVTLQAHSLDVRSQAEHLQSSMGGEVPWQAVVEAAHWHDLGKAHEAWQQMITSKREPPTSVPLAKRPKGKPKASRNRRKYFRHELASAMAYLRHDDPDDLVAFLIAAHHGKVRTSIRSRPDERPDPTVLENLGFGDTEHRVALGVYDGEPLPSVDLGGGLVTQEVTVDLSPMAMGAEGGSWLDRVARLLREHGPYRLAFLESWVRVADWRASAAPTVLDEVNDA